MPRDDDSTTPNTAAVAVAASMALPPFMSICTPASVASGWLDATMPFLATTENFPDIVSLANELSRNKLRVSINRYDNVPQKLSPSNVFIGGPVRVFPVVSQVEPPLKTCGN